MWSQFFLALLVFFVLFYVPGYLIARSLTADPIIALATAPLVSSCAYSMLSVVCGESGLYTTWVTLVIPTTLIGVACLAIAHVHHRRNVNPDGDASRFRPLSSDASSLLTGTKASTLINELKIYLPYVLFGMAVCLVYFLKPLDGPDSFTWRSDMCNHLNLIARFVNTGNWSMLHASIYENVSQAAIPSSGFYPAGWHVLASLLVSCMGVSASLAANVVNCVLIAFTIPTSSYLLVRSSLFDKPLAMRLGAIFPLAFGCFPWRLLIPPGLSPFTLGLTFAIVVVAQFVSACKAFRGVRSSVGSSILFAICLLACAFAHPSCMFTALLLLVPYVSYRIYRQSMSRFATHAIAKSILCVCGFLLLVLAAWTVCYNIPRIYGMCQYPNTAFARKADALLQVIFMGFKAVPIQPVLALFVWTGVAYSLYRTRYLWVSCGFFIFSGLYCFSATADPSFKGFVTGLWYSNVIRLSACACAIAVPLAALGFFATVRIAQGLFRLISTNRDDAVRRFRQIIIPALCITASALAVFYPSFTLPHFDKKTVTAFGYVTKRARHYNNVNNNMLSPDEREFLDRVKEVVDDDLVINFAFDGSCYAYATNDVNTFTRRFNSGDYSANARYINAHLCDISTDTRVLDLLREYDAQYVLLLDIDEHAEEATIYDDGFNSIIWRGLVELDDETPGFEVILSEGDMRLYRVVGVADSSSQDVDTADQVGKSAA